MADCFSLPNAAELVEMLRNHAEYCDMPFSWMNEAYAQAADAIEALLAENVKLKAERDDWRQKYLSSEVDATNLTGLLMQAVADLKSIAPCQKCKHFGVNQMTCDALEKCLYGEEQAWEWRGVPKEEE